MEQISLFMNLYQYLGRKQKKGKFIYTNNCVFAKQRKIIKGK